MISSHEMKKGLTLDIEGEPYIVLEWQHVEQGRESANTSSITCNSTGSCSTRSR